MTQTTEIDNIKINKYTDDDKHIFNKIWELRPSDDQYFKFMGKEIKLPRRTINYSTNGQIYSGYLGASNIIESPPQFLINYLNSINYNVHDKHNNILINFYNGGDDYIGYHKDSIKNFEDELYTIHTVSLYEDTTDFRTLRFKHIKTKENIDFKITDRTTLSFNKYINDNYKHTITKRKKGKKRISITLRNLKNNDIYLKSKNDNIVYMNINTLKVTELKRVLKDYNTKLKKKLYKMNMKKKEIVEELNKMYKITHKEKKIIFLRKGKQHSYVLNLTGSKKREAEDEIDKKTKDERKKKAEIKKKENFKKKLIKAEKDKRIRQNLTNSKKNDEQKIKKKAEDKKQKKDQLAKKAEDEKLKKDQLAKEAQYKKFNVPNRFDEKWREATLKERINEHNEHMKNEEFENIIKKYSKIFKDFNKSLLTAKELNIEFNKKNIPIVDFLKNYNSVDNIKHIRLMSQDKLDNLFKLYKKGFNDSNDKYIKERLNYLIKRFREVQSSEFSRIIKKRNIDMVRFSKIKDNESEKYTKGQVLTTKWEEVLPIFKAKNNKKYTLGNLGLLKKIQKRNIISNISDRLTKLVYLGNKKYKFFYEYTENGKFYKDTYTIKLH